MNSSPENNSLTEYWIDSRRSLEFEDERKMYQILAAWSCDSSDSFEIEYETKLYSDDPFTEYDTAQPDTSNVRIEERNSIRVRRGKIDSAIKELLMKLPPHNAITGELAPFDEIRLFVQNTLRFHSSEYGSIITINLTEQEFKAIQNLFDENKLDITLLLPAGQFRIRSTENL